MKTTWVRLHPLTQWLYYTIALVLGMLLFHPIVLLAGILVLTIVHFCAFRQFRLGKWFTMMILITFFFSIINPLFSHRGSHVVSVFSYSFTLEAVLYGLTWGLSLSMILLVFRLYQDCFPSSLFLAIFHRFSPQWSLLLMLSIRFVPMFQRRLDEIKVGQAFRYDGPVSSWREKIKRGENHILTLVSWSLEDALQTVDSMKARGYGKRVRSNYHRHRFTQRDTYLCGFMFILLLGEIYLWFLGHGRLQIYPQLEPIMPTFLGWVSIGIECLILATPLWYEGGEQLRWYTWKLKTRLLLTQKQHVHQ